MPTWNNPGPQEFDAVLEAGGGGGCLVTVPLDVPELFGAKGRVPIVAHIDRIEYRGSLDPYAGRHCLGVLKAIRAELGKDEGDSVHVELRLDTDERAVVLDPDVEQALTEAGLLEKFKAMAFTHQREYTEWISSAKHTQTRTGRLTKLITMVSAR